MCLLIWMETLDAQGQIHALPLLCHYGFYIVRYAYSICGGKGGGDGLMVR